MIPLLVVGLITCVVLPVGLIMRSDEAELDSLITANGEVRWLWLWLWLWLGESESESSLITGEVRWPWLWL